MCQSISDSRSWSSLACSCVSSNLPDPNADASSDPTLPASVCNPRTGRFIRSRLFLKESGVLVAMVWYSSNVLMSFFQRDRPRGVRRNLDQFTARSGAATPEAAALESSRGSGSRQKRDHDS
jgi:hypothetical protein